MICLEVDQDQIKERNIWSIIFKLLTLKWILIIVFKRNKNTYDWWKKIKNYLKLNLIKHYITLVWCSKVKSLRVKYLLMLILVKNLHIHFKTKLLHHFTFYHLIETILQLILQSSIQGSNLKQKFKRKFKCKFEGILDQELEDLDWLKSKINASPP